jgi:hypothetical protein
VQLHGSKSTGTEVGGLGPHPGWCRRYAPPMSDQRLARRIGAFYRLMRHRRVLAGVQVSEFNEDSAAEEYDLAVLHRVALRRLL